jgi:hypothetical protein
VRDASAPRSSDARKNCEPTMSLSHDRMQPIPVRTRLTVLRDAPPESACLVFCEAEQRSVLLARCATCGYGGDVERDHDGTARALMCSRFTLRSTPPPPPDDSGPRLAPPTHAGAIAKSAATLEVGLALVRPIVCVRYDVTVSAVIPYFEREPSAYGMAVVDDFGRFVGVLARASAALGLVARGTESVAERMALATLSIDERASLDAAFETMGVRRARELTVTDADRHVTGTLRDLDALRFVSYVSRTGLRPPFERAA